MVSDSSNEHTPCGEEPLFAKLPDYIDGFIDLQILVNIHKYLSESERNDDVDLAAWVKEYYLQEPLVEESRQVRDTEGFVRLDTAYRRVRQLTGKAQDKWPFFDRNWKKMSSTIVKRIVLEASAMGTNRPFTNSEIRDSPDNNGFDGQHDSATLTPKPQVPVGTEILAQQQVQDQSPSQPAARQLVNQSESQREAQRQGLLFRDFSLSPIPDSSVRRDDTVAGPATQNGSADTSALNGTANGTISPAGSLRDAGAGKVRGPHGRFVNKSKPPQAVTKGSNIKYVKTPDSISRKDTESEEESFLKDESTTDPVAVNSGRRVRLSSIFSFPSSEDNAMDVSDHNLASFKPSKDMHSTCATLNDSPTSSVLAAEAEAVTSNLDRLPPGYTGKKRKSESTVQRDVVKRARGSRGGVLGRPRKPEPAVTKFQSNEDKSAEIEHEPLKSETVSGVATRRSSRKSAASALELPALIEPAGGDGLQEVQQQQSGNDKINLKIKGVGTTNLDHPVKSKLNKIGHITENDDLTHDLFYEAKASDTSTAPPTISESHPSDFQKTPLSSKRKKRVSFSPETDGVEFFARVSTNAGFQEIPLSEDDLTSGINLVKRYAAWQNSGAASVTFETFKNIVKFAKQG